MASAGPRSEQLVGRALGRSGLLRRLVKSAPGQHVVHTVRAARLVRPRRRLLLRQLAGRPDRSAYRLRDTGQLVVLRHRSPDLIVLDEIHGRRSYDPPPAVQAAIDAAPVRRVVDLGGNIGLFTLEALRRYPAADVVVLEPDPGNAEVLEASVRANGAGARVEVQRAGAATAPGSFSFLPGGHIWSAAAEPGTPGAIEVPTHDAVALAEDADLLKIDIEGAEWPILADPRLAVSSARAVALEWHAEGCPAPDARAHAEKLLRRAGFEVDHDPPDLPICGTLWAWRPASR